MLTESDDHSTPPPRARLDFEGNVATPGGELRYIIVNEGETALRFGACFGFEERTAEGWRALHIRQAFAAWAAQLSPGRTTGVMSARVPQSLAPGRYRLTTRLTVLDVNGAPVASPDRTIGIEREFIAVLSAG